MAAVQSGSGSSGGASVLIIGAGNMGSALAKGLTASAERLERGPFHVRVFDIQKQRLETLCQATGVAMAEDLAAALTHVDAVVFCVKPQDLPGLGGSMLGKLQSQTLVVSILAGVTLEDIENILTFQGGIVRAMPNIAATVGEAATAMCQNGRCTATQVQLAEAIFKSIGEADWTKETLLDAVTGLSGSGPAYLYMVIEALTDGGVKMGIPRTLAAKLATQTVLGSAVLVKETGLHPAILRDQVTTPGGTTINAIHELEDRGLRAMLIRAVETATLRSAQLRQKKNQ